jgi:hypothetical protein
MDMSGMGQGMDMSCDGMFKSTNMYLSPTCTGTWLRQSSLPSPCEEALTGPEVDQRKQ